MPEEQRWRRPDCLELFLIYSEWQIPSELVGGSLIFIRPPQHNHSYKYRQKRQTFVWCLCCLKMMRQLVYQNGSLELDRFQSLEKIDSGRFLVWYVFGTKTTGHGSEELFYLCIIKPQAVVYILRPEMMWTSNNGFISSVMFLVGSHLLCCQFSASSGTGARKCTTAHYMHICS